MAKFHKSGSKEPFLWNCAATAARINRKAVYSVDIILMRTEQSRKPWKPRLSRFIGFVQVQGFWTNLSKPLHLPRERCGAPVEIRIATMAAFHKSGSKEPFLWNCAATAAQRNRKAVSSADIILAQLSGGSKGNSRLSTFCPRFLTVRLKFLTWKFFL